MDHVRTASALAADLAMREKEVRRLRSRVQTLLKEKKDERKAIRVAKAEALAAVRDATKALARETERKTHWKQKHSSQRRVSEELARRGARWRRELQDLQEQLADMEASFDALQRRNAQLKAAAESSAKAKLTAEREVAKLKQLHTAAVRRALHAEAQLEAAGIAVSPQHDAEVSPGRSPASVAGTEPSPQGTPSNRVAQLRRGGSSRRSRMSPSPAGGSASPVPSLPSPAAIPSPRPGAGSPVFPIARHNRFLESFVVAGLGGSHQTEPGVLWKYPPDVEVTPMVASMCFPSGCSVRKMDVSSSVSDFQGLLFGRGTGSRGVDSHCFLMNGGVAGAEDTQLYGIVIRFLEPAPREGTMIVDLFPRCFCLISRYPFLRLHFHVLQVLIGIVKESLLLRQEAGELISESKHEEAPGDPLRLPSPRDRPESTASQLKKKFSFLNFEMPRMPSFRSPHPSNHGGSSAFVGAAAVSSRNDTGGGGDGNVEARGVQDDEDTTPRTVSAEPPEKVRKIVARFFDTRLPPPGGEMLLSLSMSDDQASDRSSCLQFQRKSVADLRLLCGRTHAEREVSYELLWWSVPVMLSVMPLDSILQVLGAVLTEHKVLLVGGSLPLDVVSSVALAMMPLLQPLSWTGAILPVLPDCIIEMVQTPTPLIAGMSKLPEYTPLDEGTVVVHLAAARVDLCDTIAYLQVQIPGITTLYHDLTQFTNNTNHDAATVQPRFVYGEDRVVEALGFVRRVQRCVQDLLHTVFPTGERAAALQRADAIVASRPDVEHLFWSGFCRSQMVDFFHQNRAGGSEGVVSELEDVRRSLALRTSMLFPSGGHVHTVSTGYARPTTMSSLGDGLSALVTGRHYRSVTAPSTGVHVGVPSGTGAPVTAVVRPDAESDSSSDDSSDDGYVPIVRRASQAATSSKPATGAGLDATPKPRPRKPVGLTVTPPRRQTPRSAGDAIASSKSRLAVDRRVHTPRRAAANQEEILRKRLQRRRSHMDMLTGTGTANRRGANSPRAAASGTGDTADASPRTGNEQLLAERHRRQNRPGQRQASPPATLGSQIAPLSDVVKHGRRAGAASGRSSEADGANAQPARNTPRRASSMPTASAALDGAGKGAVPGARSARRRSLEPMSSRAFSTSRVSPVQASMGRRVASTSDANKDSSSGTRAALLASPSRATRTHSRSIWDPTTAANAAGAVTRDDADSASPVMPLSPSSIPDEILAPRSPVAAEPHDHAGSSPALLPPLQASRSPAPMAGRNARRGAGGPEVGASDDEVDGQELARRIIGIM